MRDSPLWTENFLRVRILHGTRQVDALRDAESDLVHVVNHLIPLEGQTRWPVMTAESEKRLLKAHLFLQPEEVAPGIQQVGTSLSRSREPTFYKDNRLTPCLIHSHCEQYMFQ